MKVDHSMQARPWRFAPLLVVVAWYGFFVPNACAAQPLPGPASPGSIEQRFQIPPVPKARPEIVIPPLDAPALSAEALKTRFIIQGA